MKTAIINLIGLFYPKKCSTCAKVLINFEEILCFSCRSNLPKTNFSKIRDNKMEIAFYGRVSIEAATSLLYYNKRGLVQKLIHQLKYKKQQQIGYFVGNWLGEEMVLGKRFESLNYIIPVPLHKNKLKKRGYNQVITFGKSLSEKLNIPMIENKLVKISKSNTQSIKNRFERWNNVQELFDLNDVEIFKNNHILLIDDVCTTGATLEACCMQLEKIKNVRISIATMAFTE